MVSRVRPLGFDMAEEGLDPGLIGGSPGRPWCWMRAMNAGARYDEDGVIGLDDDPDMRVVPLGMGERDRSGRGDGVRVGLTWSWSRRRGPVYSAAISVMAIRAVFSSTMALPAAKS